MKITQDVLAVLSRVEADAATARIVDALDRSLYVRVNKVLEALGGKWNRGRKAHVFDVDARARIDEAIVLGEVTTAQDIGFFPTPVKLAAFLVELADVEGGDRVLEPSAGTGRIVGQVNGHRSVLGPGIYDLAIVDALLAVGANVWAVERNEKMRERLVGNTRSIHDWTCAVRVLPIDDFLDLEIPDPSQRFHRVVMNPPFCRVGRGDHLDHVRHAFEFLRVDGTLVSVLPASIRFREDRRHVEFREWIAKHRGQITDLPDGSFKESGTMARTCMVQMERGWK